MAKTHKPVIGLHGDTPLHHRHIGLMASEWDTSCRAEGLSQALMIGMAMCQGDHADRMFSQLAQDRARAPARGSIDQHIFHQIDVDKVRREKPQLPDASRDPVHEHSPK
jgi:hypothetical protein